ncbi:malate dehydrogenase [Chlorella vulgaris]
MLWLIIQHLRHYSEPLFQRFIVRIIFMVPMYSICSFPSLIHPSQAIYWTTVRDCYEAWVIYNFMSLCLAYVGGPGAVEVKMHGFLLLPSCAAGTCCLPPLPVNGRFVRYTKQMALQFVLLKPILATLTLVLYSTGHYTEGDWAPGNAYLWITIFYNLTYTIALYGLLLFYLGTHELLAPFKPLLKFVLVKAVIFLSYWQGLFISIATSAGAIATAEDGVNLQSWLLCVEMLPAAIFMLFAFPWKEYVVAGGNISGGNITHAISIRDVVTDTVHQFAPAYHDYVLYSDGAHKQAVPPKTESSQQQHADLLMNMELGGVSTWTKSSSGPPAPGQTESEVGDDFRRVGSSEDQQLAGPDFTRSDEQEELPQFASKYLAREDEDAQEDAEASGWDQRHTLLAMLARAAKEAVKAASGLRAYASASGGLPPRKVAVLGAAGGIGQPLSLLMKLSPYVSELALYDIAGTPGVAADVSHINSKAAVKGYAGEDQLGEALKGADVVIIPAGVPRKPGMTRDDLFKINAGIVKALVEACGKHCPKALLNIISNPVNSTVPIAAETLKRLGVYDEKRVLGVTTLDVVRAKTFYAEKAGLDVSKVDVPVVGGHAGVTILPLFSQAVPNAANKLNDADIDALTKRTQDGGTEVVQAKAGKGSATLSMAYAGALFADACLRGLNGDPDVVECTYVASTITDAPFFSSKVKLGKNGVEQIFGLGELSAYEAEGLKALMPELRQSIQKGEDFALEKQ